MANWIKRLRLRELSFVDRPANPHAKIVLHKQYVEDPVTPVIFNPPPVIWKIAEEEPVPETFVEAIAKARRDTPQLSRTGAMSFARENYPTLFEKYQAAPSTAVGKPVEKSAAVVNFEKRVGDIRLRDRCSKSDAWRTAAREFPDEVDAYRVA